MTSNKLNFYKLHVKLILMFIFVELYRLKEGVDKMIMNHIHVFNMKTWKPGIAPRKSDVQAFSFNGYEAIILLRKIVESESWEKDWSDLFTVGEKYEPFIVGKII